MNRPVTVAVVGATGAVGETMLAILEQRDFPVGELIPLASARSAGSSIRFRGRDIEVRVEDANGDQTNPRRGEMLLVSVLIVGIHCRSYRSPALSVSARPAESAASV